MGQADRKSPECVLEARAPMRRELASAQGSRAIAAAPLPACGDRLEVHRSERPRRPSASLPWPGRVSRRAWRKSLVVGTRWSFRGKDPLRGRKLSDDPDLLLDCINHGPTLNPPAPALSWE